jgi:signal transduction histidine kinase
VFIPGDATYHKLKRKMLGLDGQSLVFIIFLGYLLSSIVYILYIVLYKSKASKLRLYVLGKFFQSILWLVLFLFPDHLSNNYVMSFVNILQYTGASIEVYCMVSINRNKLKRIRAGLTVLTMLGITVYTILSTNIILRVVVTSIFLSIIFSYLFFGLSLKRGTTKMQSVIGWIALIFVLINIARGVYTVFYSYEIPVYTNIPIQVLMALVWLIIAYTFPLLFLFIIKEKDNRELLELNITKDKFFNIIGHDLKSPIVQMIQFSQLIEENYKNLNDEKLLTFIKAMKESSVRGFKLLENLLDWARSQTGSISFAPEPFLISELIKENIELFEKQAETKNIQINAPNFYEGTVIADRNMINTVVRNLLSNAIKFTYTNGSIEIDSKAERDNIVISVKDNGQGMSCEDCNKLFKIDSGYTAVGTNNEKGTGIGLILCKEFIDKHDGSIWVESEQGEGSTFRFSIPMK